MKTLTCAQMGGSCEAKISGGTFEELVANCMTHVETAHPEMVEAIKAVPPEEMKAKFDAAPEDEAAPVPEATA